MSDSGWTDARVETLKTLWREGLSAAEIARRVGGVTRNAVLGKIHRLGLSGRAVAPRLGGQRPASVRSRPASRKPPPRPKPPVMPPVAIAIPVEEPGLATSVLQLGAHTCHWPIGDPKALDFSFCGRRAGESGPYCADHDRRAHRPGAERLDRDPFVRRLLAGLVACGGR
jgi:GcrA cell cycle regulator